MLRKNKKSYDIHYLGPISFQRIFVYFQWIRVRNNDNISLQILRLSLLISVLFYFDRENKYVFVTKCQSLLKMTLLMSHISLVDVNNRAVKTPCDYNPVFVYTEIDGCWSCFAPTCWQRIVFPLIIAIFKGNISVQASWTQENGECPREYSTLLVRFESFMTVPAVLISFQHFLLLHIRFALYVLPIFDLQLPLWIPSFIPFHRFLCLVTSPPMFYVIVIF
jgi:hypothetical protein